MKGLGIEKTTDSKITFIRDPATNLILRHEEEWTGDKVGLSSLLIFFKKICVY